MKTLYTLLTIYSALLIVAVLTGTLFNLPLPPYAALAIALIPHLVYFFLKLNQHNTIGKTAVTVTKRTDNSIAHLLVNPSNWWFSRNWFAKLSLVTIVFLFFACIGATTYHVFNYSQLQVAQQFNQDLKATNLKLAQIQASLNNLSYMEKDSEVEPLKAILNDKLHNLDKNPETEILGSSTSGEMAVKSLDDINQQIEQTLANLELENPTPAPTSPMNQSYPNSATGGLTTSTGQVTIASKVWPDIDVYQKPSVSAKVVGEMYQGVNYPLSNRSSDWYQITLSGSTTGWVPAQLVKEVFE